MNIMDEFKIISITLFLLQIILANCVPRVIETDVCVYGSTSAGMIAAYTAKKLGKTSFLIEPGIRIGGMTAGGLGWTDFGYKSAIIGYAREFYHRISKHYNKTEQWTFEPKAALEVYQSFLKEVNLTVLYRHELHSVDKNGSKIASITLKSSKDSSQFVIVNAKVFIDCTYEGDLMARANVSYSLGRESNAVYNETYNGVQLRGEHQFPDGIDPYKVVGKKESGLLWGISNETLQRHGSGDKKIQAYNFRICLTNDPINRVSITKPKNYDASKYQLLLRVIHAKNMKSVKSFLKFSMVTSRKTDINNQGPFSTDMIGMNYEYPQADHRTRDRILTAHKEYTQGLLYFVTHDASVPLELRNQMFQWGYPKDEYLETDDHFTPILYIRESRRMISEYVMTQANCEGHVVVNDGIANASYTMDSHNAQRIVVNGMVKNEGDVQKRGIKPYPISYRSITPKREEVTNLLVPVCLSASHIAYGSIRMEPVFMQLGQVSGYAAVNAILHNIGVQHVNVSHIKEYIKTNQS